MHGVINWPKRAQAFCRGYLDAGRQVLGPLSGRSEAFGVNLIRVRKLDSMTIECVLRLRLRVRAGIVPGKDKSN